MGQEKKGLYSYFLYTSSIIGLLWLAHYYTIAIYIVYLQTVVYFSLALICGKMRMGPTGEEIWTGKKVTFVASSSLVLLLGLAGAVLVNFRLVSFLESAPFGLVYGWWAYKLFTRS